MVRSNEHDAQPAVAMSTKMTEEERRAAATAAVKCINDPAQRDLAYQAILSYISDPTPWRSYTRCENLGWVAGGVLLAIAGISSLWCSAPIGWLIATMVDGCVFVLLVMAAIRSDGHVSISKYLPNKLAALALFMLLFIALMPSFGSMYLQSGGVCQAGVEAGHVGNSAGENFAALQTPLDALYFSCVTMMTVGYGDYVPITPCARRLVIWQLGSGALLLLGAFPLLLSRMAAFPNDGQS